MDSVEGERVAGSMASAMRQQAWWSVSDLEAPRGCTPAASPAGARWPWRAATRRRFAPGARHPGRACLQQPSSPAAHSPRSASAPTPSTISRRAAQPRPSARPPCIPGTPSPHPHRGGVTAATRMQRASRRPKPPHSSSRPVANRVSATLTFTDGHALLHLLGRLILIFPRDANANTKLLLNC